MYDECTNLLQDLLEAARDGQPLLQPQLRDRVQLAMALLVEARDESMAQQRFASLGRLAAAVLHELLNPLAFLQTNLEVLSANLPRLLSGEAGRDPEMAEDTKAMVTDSRAGVERISAALSALRVLLRDDPPGPTRGDAVRAAGAAARLLTMRLPPGVKLVQDLSDTPPVACGDGLMGQVLLHLLLRSLDSVGAQGSIKLVVRPLSDAEVGLE